jgi:hypothetical protein
MRYAPKDAVIASHEVAANVMQTGRLAAGEFDAAVIGLPDRLERGAHFDVIEQWRSAMRLSFAIDRGP